MHFNVIFRPSRLYRATKAKIQVLRVREECHRGPQRDLTISASVDSVGKTLKTVHQKQTIVKECSRTFFPSLPLVMSTHKAEDSPSKTYNGMANGIGPKTPFLIGVAGGTASGKVRTRGDVSVR